MAIRLRDRFVVVTGSSGGIGTAIVADLREQGARVVGVDQRPPTGAAPDTFLAGDVTSEETLNLLATAVSDCSGGLWGVVHAAGQYPITRLDEYTPELWRVVQAVNVEALFRIVGRLRCQIGPGGRVVAIASGAAHVGSRDPGYSASKAAVNGLVRSLAMELAEQDILVNAVTPGVIDTPMSARMDPDRRARHLGQSLLGRAGTPLEVAVAVRFLLDPENTYMTGASLDVNGGLYLR